MTDGSRCAIEFHMVPVDEIVRIAAVFAHIEWPLTSDRIDPLVSALGWTRRPHATGIRLSTNLPVNQQRVFVSAPDGNLEEMDCYVSDFLPDGSDLLGTDVDKSSVVSAFTVVRQSLSDVYGAWSSHRPGDAWRDLSTGGRLRLSGDGLVLALRILSRRYADVERDEERLGISPDRVLGEDE